MTIFVEEQSSCYISHLLRKHFNLKYLVFKLRRHEVLNGLWNCIWENLLLPKYFHCLPSFQIFSQTFWVSWHLPLKKNGNGVLQRAFLSLVQVCSRLNNHTFLVMPLDSITFAGLKHSCKRVTCLSEKLFLILLSLEPNIFHN